MIEALEDILEAIPTVTIAAQTDPLLAEGTTKPLAVWYRRYNYLPPRQRAGRILQIARHSKHMKHQQLAEATGIAKAHLLEMEHGFRAIEEEEAQRLATVLEIDAQPLLEAFVTA